MEPRRRQRYRDKVAHARERITDLQEWLGEAAASKVHRLAAYKALQELVEALTDLIAMTIKDGGDLPGDDYSNIDRLQRDGRLDARLAGALKQANGLRNRIVHEYNGSWDDVGLETIERLLPALESTIKEADRWP